jgi:7-carboxy-7-deazaguanine synthase
MDVSYPVVETFHSLQGEGAWMGASAFFIRLGGCDVHCPFCDTKESWNAAVHPRQHVKDLAELVERSQPAIAVITGGEPLMHNLTALTDALKSSLNADSSLRLHLETSGAYPLSGDFDWITLSPKKFKPPQAGIYDRTQELKIVVSDVSDLEWAEQQASLICKSTAKNISDRMLMYLQPDWNRPESQKLIFDYIIHHPQWRLSLQTHKFLGVR